MRNHRLSLEVVGWISCIMFNLCALETSAQDLSGLSDQGYGHWMSASRLAETASNVDDYLLIAQEYEEVIKTDSQFEDTYLKLIQLYEKIGVEKGTKYFDKADKLLDQYALIKPGDNRTIQAERSYISALRDKYNKGPNRFVGRWGYSRSNQWYVEIKYDGKEYSLVFFEPVESITKENDYSFLIEEKPSDYDHSQELRRKGWDRYVDDRDSDADPGYPTTGRYYYNRTRIVAYRRIILEGDAPKISTPKLHEWYYLDGSLTYAKTMPLPHDSSVLVKK